MGAQRASLRSKTWDWADCLSPPSSRPPLRPLVIHTFGVCQYHSEDGTTPENMLHLNTSQGRDFSALGRPQAYSPQEYD